MLTSNLPYLEKKLIRLIFAHLNISTIRNKFHQLVQSIKGNKNVFMLLEPKLDESFVPMLFQIMGYCPTFR